MFGTALRRPRPGGRFRLLAGALPALIGSAPALLVLVGAAPAMGQIRVEGEVIDARSGLPVAGAIVHLPDLGVGSISDEFGYFMLDSVPRGVQIVAVHRDGYETVEQPVHVVLGELWEVRITPAAIKVRGIEVAAATSQELEVARTGRRSDFIAPSTVAEAAERTNKVLEVLRSKAPPRLQYPSGGGYRGRDLLHRVDSAAPSVRAGTHGPSGQWLPADPCWLLDGVIVYSHRRPYAPWHEHAAGFESARVKWPRYSSTRIRRRSSSIRVLSPDRRVLPLWQQAGRSGAVEISHRASGQAEGRLMRPVVGMRPLLLPCAMAAGLAAFLLHPGVRVEPAAFWTIAVALRPGSSTWTGVAVRVAARARRGPDAGAGHPHAALDADAGAGGAAGLVGHVRGHGAVVGADDPRAAASGGRGGGALRVDAAGAICSGPGRHSGDLQREPLPVVHRGPGSSSSSRWWCWSTRARSSSAGSWTGARGTSSTRRRWRCRWRPCC